MHILVPGPTRQQALCILHESLRCLAQGTGDHLSPSQLQCSRRQRQTPEEDAALSVDANVPQQAAAMQSTLQLGKATGKHVHTNVLDNAYTCLYVYHVHQVNACGPINQPGHPVQHCSKALLRVSLRVL